MRAKTLIVFCIAIIFSCKVGVTSSNVSASDEDLSQYMYKPQSKKIDSSASVVPDKVKTTVKFEKDINVSLTQIIDSMAIANKRYQSAPGYRIMVYSGNSSQESAEAKKAIYDWSTDHDVYAQYKQPAFRVKVGNFQDRIMAYDVLSDVIKIFPNAVIVPDQIEIK